MERIGSVIKRVEQKYKAPTLKDGFTQIKNSVITSDKLTPNEKLVYICLRMHKMHKTVAFPSFTTIAKEIGYSRRGVADCIKSLLEKGAITREKRFYRSNRYSFPTFNF